MTNADASFLILGQIAGAGSLVLIFIGFVLLHIRLRNLASLSLLIALAANVLWYAWGQSLLDSALTSPPIATTMTGAAGNNAQEVIDAMTHGAPTENMVIAGDAFLVIWLGLSFVLAVASIRHAHQRGSS